jgi:Protein of unknown function (DUF1549)/Protein of unknown function (DUF1553)
MFGRNHVLRCLSLLMLTALFGLILSNLSDAAEKKDKTESTPSKALTAKSAGTRLDQATISHLIDQQVNERLAAEKIVPSDRADDAEFLRRACLDITGHIPSAEKAAAFLDSKDANKRAKLIDELLASPDYGRHMADIWQNLLIVHNSDNRRLNAEPMVEWLKDNFNQNKSWDKTVHEIVTASGEVDKNPAATYFVSQGTVDKMTDNVTKVFLGVQLQCAQCHNHPFAEYKQTEYWGMAAFFLKVQAGNPNKAAKQGETITVSEIEKPRRGKNGLPESAKLLPPKFLGGDTAKVSNGPLRPTLADWMTTAKNPFFSKAMVNRTWAQLMGRGLVNPVDDMRDGNEASHPQLLVELAEQFSANGFDVKFLIRAICNSEAYQRTSRPNSSNKEASSAIYSRMAVKMMTGEQLVDSLEEVVGPPTAGGGGRGKGMAAAKGANRSPRANLVAFFGGDENADVTEYQDGIPQVLRLMNSPALSRSPKLMEIGRTAKTPEQAIEKIFLATLSRRPKQDELNKLTAYVQKVGPRDAYSDILWAVLNSSEFRVNR